MKKSSLSGIDIAGITLGTIAILVVIFAIAAITSPKSFGIGWPRLHGAWSHGDWSEWAHGWSGGSMKEEKDQAVPGSFREVEIKNVAGEIRVTGGSASGVQVHWVKTAFSPRALEALEVEIDPQGDRLVIREKREDWAAMRFGSVSYLVTLPAGVKSVVAHSVSGSITVDNVEGMDQSLETVSGSISTSKSRDLHANTTSGAIDFVFAGKTLDAHSISGSVKGDIRSIEKGGSVKIGTVSGSVDMSAFEGLDADLALRSLSGRVSCELPITVSMQKNNALEGKAGTGTIPVDVSTTSGSINLHKL